MNPTHDETWRARVHLAAANRLAVYDDLEEGIDNHFTMRVPGQDDRYLVLPFGQHWSEARASDLIVFNEAGDVLEGSGGLELSALSIHAPLHRLTGANVILHTHQTWALALNMLEDNRLQALALSVAEAGGPAAAASQVRLIETLEDLGQLDRRTEGLAPGEQLLRRAADGQGLTRPELAVLLYALSFWIGTDEPRALLMRRRKPPVGLWENPGGILEAGEDFEGCARREALMRRERR